jgi:predicted DNA-binding transcriptional regulator AlpA
MNTQLKSEQMLSRKGLSARWEISVPTLKRREAAGTLPYLKLGRAVRYRLSDIERIEREAEVA